MNAQHAARQLDQMVKALERYAECHSPLPGKPEVNVRPVFVPNTYIGRTQWWAQIDMLGPNGAVPWLVCDKPGGTATAAIKALFEMKCCDAAAEDRAPRLGEMDDAADAAE